MTPSNQDLIEIFNKSSNYNDITEALILIWSSKAQYLNVNEKREQRLQLLIDIQTIINTCDPEGILIIINGLIAQVHGTDYILLKENLHYPIQFSNKAMITCNVCLRKNIDQITSKFEIRLLDILIPHVDHLFADGCPVCVSKSKTGMGGYRRKTTASYIADNELVHKNKFDYRLVSYLNSRSNPSSEITIICRTCFALGLSLNQTNSLCGIFTRRAGEHIRNKGCPLCYKREWGQRTSKYMANAKIKQKLSDSIRNRDRTLPARVYYLQIDREGFNKPLFKIGYTSRRVSKRISELLSANKGFKITKISECWFANGTGAESLETSILNDPETQKYLYKPNHRTKNNPGPSHVLKNGVGDNELFIDDIMIKIPRIGRLFKSLASNNISIIANLDPSKIE